MKNQKYHTVGTVQIAKNKIVGRGKMDTPITQVTSDFTDLVQTLQ